MTTERDLIQRLADELDTWLMAYHHGGVPPDIQHAATLVTEARAYLAQPEPEGLTDEPLGDLIDKWVQEAFRKKPYGCKHPTHTYVACKAFEHGRNHEARAYLAQPEPEGPTVMDPRGCPTPGACSCPTSPTVPPDLIRALELAEAALADIGDAEREPGDDLAWAEARAAQDLPRLRSILARWGK